MAKKFTKPPKRGAKKGKAPKRPAARAKAPKGPRSQSLPGMEQVRNKRLDTLCESIGEGRDIINQSTTDVEADSQLALQIMQKESVTHYTHAGVELILRRGADKLSVKLLKDKTAEGAPAKGRSKAPEADTPDQSGEGDPDDTATDIGGEAAELN